MEKVHIEIYNIHTYFQRIQEIYFLDFRKIQMQNCFFPGTKYSGDTKLLSKQFCLQPFFPKDSVFLLFA